MRNDILTWRHVFKLDPDRDITDDQLQLLCQSGSDAIIVGGSTGVTYTKTFDLLTRIRRFALPCILEVSSLEAIVPGFDLYFIPLVLNSQQVKWITGLQHKAIKTYGANLPWQMMLTEGYIVLNPQSAVAKLTDAETMINAQDVLAYAKMAEQLFQCPIVYLEYSGVFGDMAMVEQVSRVLNQARLFYGGGIDSLQRARQAAAVAHTIVVGNIIYEDINLALETVKVNEQMY